MEISKNVNLKSYNTFCISAYCQYFAKIESQDDLTSVRAFLEKHDVPVLTLGKGSNILFIDDFQGLILINAVQGIKKISETESEVLVEAGSGTLWRDFVDYCVENNWGGIENLAGIPGTVGASAVQNIGAYDMEAGNAIVETNVFDLKTGEHRVMTNRDCRFEYRASIFKRRECKNLIITKVQFCLQKNPLPKTSYRAISEGLKQKNINSPTILDIRDLVMEIRASKLPCENVLGNAGSFFKNPCIGIEHYENLKNRFPNIPFFVDKKKLMKISAAWLIEQCGWKGKSLGNVATYEKHALVLVNRGGASGKDVLTLAKAIQNDVFEKFSIFLEPEVILVPQNS